MNPLASAATAQYQNVFGVLVIPYWVAFVVMGVLTIGAAVGGGLLWTGEKKRTKWVGAVIVLIALAQAVIIGSMANGQMDDLKSRISANIQQKYGATLDESSDPPRFEEYLTSPFKYKLDFPDGGRAEYMIRFDRNTSEPFVVTTPTSDQLEQNGKK